MGMATTHALGTHRTHAPAWLVWLGFVVLCLGVGFLSSLTGRMELYRELVRPSWSPPAAVFGPVWSALYVLMGTATFLIWRRTSGERRRTAITVFAIQLALNFAWTPVFFGLERVFAALVVIALVWVSVLAMAIVYARRVRLAGAMNVPLLAWVTFAGALNAAIWWLNR
jgi:tryptophan-rich sensory protein